MKNERMELKYLRKEIERKSPVSLEHKTNFIILANFLNKAIETNSTTFEIIDGLYDNKSYFLSAETLMRFWNFKRNKDYEKEMEDKSYSLLAYSAGYKGWNDFVNQ